MRSPKGAATCGCHLNIQCSRADGSRRVGGAVISARTRDVSTLGMSVLIPCRPPWTQVNVLVALPSRPEPASLKARVVVCAGVQEGGFEVGLAFA